MVSLDSPSGPAPSSWQVLAVPHADQAARSACRSIRDDLTRHQLAGRVLNDAVIVAGELVINAVEHGRPDDTGTIEVAWTVAEGHLVLRVADAGEGPTIAQGDVSDDGMRGRGLAMVAAICDDWSVSRNGRTTFTARIPL
ncbi:ATP-binding protein [Nocardioides alkalitolerans]|uniref:ATP-binding protein n=1 Tax=Nocardioides alkalitolerans TaxID=281714 RepID=UPI00041D27D6|nr:ATP-binding protein [Nocardioides alkalitolerans]